MRISTQCVRININVLELKLSCPTTHLVGTTNKLNHYEIGEYADDAWEAVKNAREDVPYLHEHPFSLDSIKKEE